MKSVRADRSLGAALALGQRPDGMRLSEIANAIDAPLTSAQRAVESLRGAGLVDEAPRDGERRYVLSSEHPARDEFLRFAERALPVNTALDIVCRASISVQFAGADKRGYLIVASPFDEPTERLRLIEALDRIRRDRSDAPGYEIIEREDVRQRLFDGDVELRKRGLALRKVKGSAARAFRDPRQHGDFDARPIHAVHPALRPIRRRVIADIARRYGLDRVLLFGSAVRDDFRDDSDVDVLVYPHANRVLRLAELIDIRQQLENVFDRDVDVVTPRSLDARVASRALSTAVEVYEQA